MKRFWFLSLLSVFGASFFLAAQSSSAITRLLTYEEARPVLQTLSAKLPVALKGQSTQALEQRWPAWVKEQDIAVRARLLQGDEDTLINYLLFGTTFTKQPRVTVSSLNKIRQSNDPANADGVIAERLDDLVKGMSSPGHNERLVFLQKLVALRGLAPAASGRAKLKDYLVAHLKRVLAEQAAFDKALEGARLQGDAASEAVERSKLLQQSGLSLDTSWQPNYALEQALQAMQARGLLKPGTVNRVAVIGPGLDFTDKAGGYDFYPQQTIQPFALMDSLMRTGLSQREQLQLTAFDLSPRVLDHLLNALARTHNGGGYPLQLPLDEAQNLKPELVRYWQEFGNQIGKPVKPVAVPSLFANLQLRAVEMPADLVKRITPVNLNIVWQRAAVSEPFDLIVATNILVYYDVLEQSLALTNIQQMLRPGGFLLANNVLQDLPTTQMRAAGKIAVSYSSRPDDGDQIVWYQRTQ